MNTTTETLLNKAVEMEAVSPHTAGNTTERISVADMKAAVLEFVEEVRQLRLAYYTKDFPTLMGRDGSEDTEVTFGRRYAKLINGAKTSGQSVHSFVDMTNGDILKSASWKAPAKHARGNIFNADRMTCINNYGAAYL